MRLLKTALLVLGLVALGIVLCPQTPRKVDPDQLLLRLLDSRETTEFRAHREYERAMLGTTQRWTGWVCSPGDGRDENDEDLPAIALDPHQNLQLIRENYTLLVEGQDKIAGREAWVVRLKPCQKRFPWKQLWVDKETFVVLAQREWSGRNRIISSMNTLSIAYTGSRSAEQQREATAASELQPPAHAPVYVPPGYRLYECRSDQDGGVCLAYSDGLFVMSVNIVERGNASDSGWRVTDAGQALVCEGTANSRQVTVIADLPAEELIKVAESVR